MEMTRELYDYLTGIDFIVFIFMMGALFGMMFIMYLMFLWGRLG